MDNAEVIGSVKYTLDLDDQNFKAKADEASREFNNLGDKADQMRGIAEQAAAIVTVQAAALGLMAKQAIDVASNFEQTQTSFGTLLGSEQKAADLMKEIMQLEVKTPFDIQTLTDAAKQMLAFGVNSKNVVPIMSELTDMSQGQASKLTELVSIYGQVNAIQQLNGREVLRLSSIGIPIYQAIEDHFKKIGDTSMTSGEAVKNAIAKGTITSQTFNEILTEMTSKGGLFFKENIRQMSTFSGIISSTKSQIQYAILNIMGIDIGAANEVRKGGLFDTLRTMAAQLLDGLQKLQPVFKAIGENKAFQYAIEGIVLAIASLVVILPIVILALNPVALAIFALEAVIAALYVAWNTNFLGIQNITKSFTTTIAKLWKDHGAQILADAKQVWDVIVAVIKVSLDLITGIFKVAGDLFKGNWMAVLTDLKGMFVNIWNDISQVVKNAINGMIDSINGLIRGANSLTSKIKLPAIPTIPHLASGIENYQGGLALVGEQGPELVNLPRGSDVIPNNKMKGAGQTINIHIDRVGSQQDINSLITELGFRQSLIPA